MSQNAQAPLVHQNLHCLANPLQPCLFLINIFFTRPSSSSCPIQLLSQSLPFSPQSRMGCNAADRWTLYVKGSLGLGVVGRCWWEGLYGEELGFRHCLFSLLVYKNVYLMPHKRPCAHLWPLPPTYVPFPHCEAHGERSTKQDEGGFPVSFHMFSA